MELTRRTLLSSALAAAATPAIAAPAVMRIGITTSLVMLDPLRTTLGDEYIYDNLVFNGLTRMNADLSVGPDLAESWTSTEDLKQWTFTLRRGVKFHNGREMVADDVIAGFTRLLGTVDAGSGTVGSDLVGVTGAFRLRRHRDLSRTISAGDLGSYRYRSRALRCRLPG